MLLFGVGNLKTCALFIFTSMMHIPKSKPKRCGSEEFYKSVGNYL